VLLPVVEDLLTRTAQRSGWAVLSTGFFYRYGGLFREENFVARIVEPFTRPFEPRLVSEACLRSATNGPPEYGARVAVRYEWRGAFDNGELNELHAEAFKHAVLTDDWLRQVTRHSLGWVCAREDVRLVGFVNVAWDGGVHAFVVDTMVAKAAERRGIGKGLVAALVEGARAADCEWLHVDFDDHLRHFYFNACGFTPTNAGLIVLR
jgi:GNAT superfamily N-acetyltransferase